MAVSLPSLIHRIGRSKVDIARELALSHKCQLKRVRRSRHWQLLGEVNNLEAFADQLDQLGDYLFVTSKIRGYLTSLKPRVTIEQRLASIIAIQPNITLSQLMAETNCSEAQARRARFEAETF